MRVIACREVTPFRAPTLPGQAPIAKNRSLKRKSKLRLYALYESNGFRERDLQAQPPKPITAIFRTSFGLEGHFGVAAPTSVPIFEVFSWALYKFVRAEVANRNEMRS